MHKEQLRHGEPSKWDWIPANFPLETVFSGVKQTIDTNPTIVLTHPEGDTHPEPYVTLVIDTEKQLKFNEEQGWNWHKSWNLPNIVVRLEIKDAQSQELLLSPKNMFAQLFAVKKVQEGGKTHLVDVGLRGTSKIELIDGQAYFCVPNSAQQAPQALRFASTSYNNEGVKFHLLMVIYIQPQDYDKPQFLNSTISPPIFVDSRKSAANSEQKKFFLYAEPFAFDLLDKKYYKRENKKKSDQDLEIENDFESLFNYLTAPNIRHKVKHPLFLIIKFSRCVSLYYNESVTTDKSLPDIMEKLQQCLAKEIVQKPVTATTEKLFLIYIEENADQNKNKKVIEAIEFLNTASIEIVRRQDQILPKFCKVGDGDADAILEAYKSHFDELLKIFHSQASKYNFGSSSESSSDSESIEKRGKKVKLNPEDASQPKVQSGSDPKTSQASGNPQPFSHQASSQPLPHMVAQNTGNPQHHVQPPHNGRPTQERPEKIEKQEKTSLEKVEKSEKLEKNERPQRQQLTSTRQPPPPKQPAQPTQHPIADPTSPFMLPPQGSYYQNQQDLFQQMMMHSNQILNPLLAMQQQLFGQQMMGQQQQPNQQQQQLTQQLLQSQYLQYLAQMGNPIQQRQVNSAMGGLGGMPGMPGLMQSPLLNQSQMGQMSQNSLLMNQALIAQLGPNAAFTHGFPSFGMPQQQQPGQFRMMGQPEQQWSAFGLPGMMQMPAPQQNNQGGNKTKRDIKEELN